MYDPIKFKFYYEYIVNQIYSENQAGGNNSMTKFVMKEFINPMNLEKNVIDLLETNRETDREIKETLLISLTDTIDEYEKNKKLRNNILKQINEFK
jgi:hypothetical protein